MRRGLAAFFPPGDSCAVPRLPSPKKLWAGKDRIFGLQCKVSAGEEASDAEILIRLIQLLRYQEVPRMARL